MMLAWFSSSEMTASSGAEQRLEQSAVGVEAGAVKNRVFGAEELRSSLRSSSLCRPWVPQMKRTEARP